MRYNFAYASRQATRSKIKKFRVFLFHQYFLSKDGAGGSRWNQISDTFCKDKQTEMTVYAGSVSYLTSQRVSSNVYYSKERIRDNLQVVRTWTYQGYNKNFLGRLLGYFSYCLSSLLASLFAPRPDVIIVTSPPLFIGITALILSIIKRSKLIFEVRDLWPESAITTGVLSQPTLIKIMYALEALLYRRASHIVVLTPGFKRDIERRFPETKNKISIITNAADFDLMDLQTSNSEPSINPQTKDIKNLREQNGWKDKFVMAYFGAHGLANDLQQIIEAATVLKEKSPDVHFVLVGDGMQKPALKRQSLERGLTNISFIDPVPKSEVSQYIRAADVGLAILKKSDTFKTVYPNKVFDYMCCERPILFNIDGDIRELIETNNAGYYFEANDTEAFCSSVLQLKEKSAEQRNALGQNGRQLVERSFDRRKLAHQYNELVRNC